MHGLWVYVLLLLVIYMGFRASRARVFPLRKLFILPVAVLLMSISIFFQLLTINPAMLASTWVVAALMGGVIGYWQISRFNIQVDKQRKLVQLPGTWSTMVIILAIFFAKYFFGERLVINPQQALELKFQLGMLAITGLITGVFWGRLLHFIYRMRKGPSVDLVGQTK